MQEAIQARYQALRNKLNTNKYHEPLHPDSIALVQKLMKNLERTSIQYNNLLKKNSQNNSQISNNSSYVSKSSDQFNTDYKLELLNKQYIDTKKKLKQRQQQVELLKNGGDGHGRIQEIREKYDNKINQLLNVLDKLQKREKDLTKQNKKLEETINQLSRQLDNGRDELASKQRTLLNETQQRINIRKQYDNILNTTNSIDNRRVEEMNAIIQRKSSRIQQLQQELRCHSAKIVGSKKDQQEMEIQRKHLVLQNKNLNCLVSSLKQQIKDLNSSDSNFKLKNEQLLKQLQASKKYRSSLQKQLQQMQASQIQRNYSSEAKDSAKSKLNMMYQQTYKQLTDKTLQYQTLQGQKQALQNIVQTLESKVKEVSNKNVVLNKNIGNLQQEYQLINNKYSQKVKQCHELNIKKQHLQRISKQYQPTKLRCIELQSKYNELLANGQASNDLQIRGKKELQHQIRVLKQQIELLRQTNSQREIQLQKQTYQLQKFRIFSDNGSKQIQLINSQKQSLLKENNELKQQLDSLSLKVTNTKTQNLKKIQKINSDEILIYDIKNKLDVQTQKMKTILDEYKLLQTNLRKTQQKNKQLYQDNIQLKSMYESVEHKNNQLLGRLKRSDSQKQFIESDKIKESAEINQLRNKIQLYEQKISQNQSALIQINNLRDDHQEQLNKALQQNFDLQERVKQLEIELRQQHQCLGQNQYSLMGLQQANKNLQNQNSILNRKYQKISDQNRGSKNLISRYQSDIERQNNEIALLVANNKDLTKQITMMQSSIASITNTAQQRRRELDQSRANAQMNRIESEQLQQTFMENANQRKRLQGMIKQMEQQNHRMYDILQIRDQQIGQFNQIVTSQKYKQAQYVAEINNYQKKLNLLTNEVNLKDEDFRRASMERDFLKSQVSCSRRQTNIDWKSLMEERLQQTQCELNLKKRQIDNYVMENQKLNTALENERYMNYKLTKQIDQIKFGSHLNTPIRNLICESLQTSQIQNSSLHSNQGGDTFRERDNAQMTSFDSQNSLSSKDLMMNYKKINQKYSIKVAGISMKGIKKQIK